MRLTIAILAAGQSRRFGEQDKLAALLRGKMLGLHIAGTLAELPAEQRLVIASDQQHPCASGWRELGFKTIPNPNADAGMGTSLALAAKAALDQSADALLVCLADMPLVPLAHLRALVDSVRKSDTMAIAASSDGRRPMPPACFRSGRIEQLADLSGDIGARELLPLAQLVECEPQLLIDIDEQSDLDRIGEA